MDEAQTTGNRKFILIRDEDVLIGTDSTKLVKRLTNYQDTRDMIFKYFPKLNQENVEKALTYFFNKKSPA